MAENNIFTKKEIKEHEEIAKAMHMLALKKTDPLDKIISIMEFLIKKIVKVREKEKDLKIKIYKRLIKVLEKLIEEEEERSK